MLIIIYLNFSSVLDVSMLYAPAVVIWNTEHFVSTKETSLGVQNVINFISPISIHTYHVIFTFICCLGVSRKTRIIDVVYNASNNELERTKTLVKNAIVVIDATPFRQWYESHYYLPLGRVKGAKLVSVFRSRNRVYDCVMINFLRVIWSLMIHFHPILIINIFHLFGFKW